MTKGDEPMNPWNPKFPWNNEADNGYGGLTKREYFAAMAMQGLLTRLPQRLGGEPDLGIIESKRIVEESTIMADVLIEQLNK